MENIFHTWNIFVSTRNNFVFSTLPKRNVCVTTRSCSVVRGDFRHDPSLKQEFFELVRQQEALLST
jgi:hypothetical protein